MMTYVCYPSTQEAETEASEVQNYSQKYSKFKAQPGIHETLSKENEVAQDRFTYIPLTLASLISEI